MGQVKHVSGAMFKNEVMESPVPVLVDFYADWCMPCRMMGPILDKVALQTAGKAKVVKVNVDEEPELANAFHVSSIPALAVISGGKVVAARSGVTQADQLVRMLDDAATVRTA